MSAERETAALRVAVSQWRGDTGGRKASSDPRYPFRLNAWVERYERVGDGLESVDPVHDGDTFDVTVDWGKRRWEVNQPIRLLGCAARELDAPGGVEAAAHLGSLLPAGSWVGLQMVRDDKFAPRWDCTVAFLLDGQVTDLATHLVWTHWAAPWNGRGVQPVPPWPRPEDS